jgi:hypothetical protein
MYFFFKLFYCNFLSKKLISFAESPVNAIGNKFDPNFIRVLDSAILEINHFTLMKSGKVRKKEEEKEAKTNPKIKKNVIGEEKEVTKDEQQKKNRNVQEEWEGKVGRMK